MHPVLLTFHLGGALVVVHAYSTFYELAWVVAVVLGTVVAQRRGFSWWRVLVTFAVALAVGVIGSRLLDLWVNWGYYAPDLSRAYRLGFRGFSLDGGLVLALATALLLTRAFRLPLWRLADSAVPALAAGIVLMRVGCLLNGCCFGTTTSLPWGVTYAPGSPAWIYQVATGRTGLLGFSGAVRPVHPTQVYEMIAAVVMCGVAIWLMRGRGETRAPLVRSGVPFLAFALGFTIFRLGNYFLRVRLPTGAEPTWFYPVFYMVLSAGLVGVLTWRLRGRPNKEEKI